MEVTVSALITSRWAWSKTQAVISETSSATTARTVASVIRRRWRRGAQVVIPRRGTYRDGRYASASIVRSMPKMKTHSGAKKRFRKTAKGKYLGRRAYSSHILEKKSPGRKRRMKRPSTISDADRGRVKKLLAGGGR